MASISPTSRPGYVYDSATDTWIPIGIGPHTHQATDLSGVVDDALIDAKGDLIVGSAADTPARLAVGNNGETLVADSSATTGLRWQGNFSAGKNAIINGDFGIWQRGTSFSNPATAAFTSDRWSVVWDGSGATRTISQQTFTPGTAPVAGYEGRFFYRFNQSVAGTGGTYNLFQNRMEDVRTFAGQTVTISFWGKAAASTSLVKLNLEQGFGTGGSPSGDVSTDIANTNFTLTTSWQRFSVTTTVPSISGKTVGTTTPGYLGLRFWIPVNSTFTIDIWGVQVEAGSVATAFQTATGTLAGELAACQRYYFRLNATDVYTRWAPAIGQNGTSVQAVLTYPVQMRTKPTSLDYSNLAVYDTATVINVTSASFTDGGVNSTYVQLNVASGVTQYRPYQLLAGNNASAYIGLSAEL